MGKKVVASRIISSIGMAKVCVILRNDKEFDFYENRVALTNGDYTKNIFRIKRESEANFIEIARVTYSKIDKEKGYKPMNVKVVNTDIIASFYKGDVKHYAVL